MREQQGYSDKTEETIPNHTRRFSVRRMARRLVSQKMEGRVPLTGQALNSVVTQLLFK